MERAEKLLSEKEQGEVVTCLATNPKCGVVIEGTGGLRKVRFALEGRGKSGGIRVVYFFHNETVPLFLLTVFAKNEKSNLSKKERNQLAKLTRVLKEQFKRG